MRPWREPARFLLIWTAVCMVPAYFLLAPVLEYGIGPCPGMTCGVTIWGLIVIAVVWLGVTGLVLYLWFR
jgi:hypothetical protein